jgi:hypothetical protein
MGFFWKGGFAFRDILHRWPNSIIYMSHGRNGGNVIGPLFLFHPAPSPNSWNARHSQEQSHQYQLFTYTGGKYAADVSGMAWAKSTLGCPRLAVRLMSTQQQSSGREASCSWRYSVVLHVHLCHCIASWPPECRI